MTGPEFDDAFRARFEDLIRWRRDVRRFTQDPVDTALVRHLLDLADLAPSVGLSQPWRFVSVEGAPHDSVNARPEAFTGAMQEFLAAVERGDEVAGHYVV